MPRPVRSQRALRESFADSLVRLRLEAGLNKTRFARRVGLSLPLVVQYEQGKKLPSVETLVLMAAVLDVDVSDLLGLKSRRLPSAK